MADTKQTIADYVGDMIALQDHILKAVQNQVELASQHPTAGAAVNQFVQMLQQNLDELRQHQQQVGTTAGNPIIDAGAAVLGMAAGLIDKIRTEGVSKALRDDYTAFNHAAIGYTMLHVTALALGEQATAQLAKRGLTNHAAAVQHINHIIGDVVVWELEKDNHTIADRQAASQNRQTVDAAWKATDQSGGASSAMSSYSQSGSGAMAGV